MRCCCCCRGCDCCTTWERGTDCKGLERDRRPGVCVGLTTTGADGARAWVGRNRGAANICGGGFWMASMAAGVSAGGARATCATTATEWLRMKNEAGWDNGKAGRCDRSPVFYQPPSRRSLNFVLVDSAPQPRHPRLRWLTVAAPATTADQSGGRPSARA